MPETPKLTDRQQQILDLVRQRATLSLCGNHDLAVLGHRDELVRVLSIRPAHFASNQ